MSDLEKAKKALGIKIKIVDRIRKDKISYEREEVEIRARINKMKEDKQEPSLIRKNEEVLQENSMMLPDCGRRLNKAFQDLEGFLETNQDLIGDTEDYKKAIEMVAEWRN